MMMLVVVMMMMMMMMVTCNCQSAGWRRRSVRSVQQVAVRISSQRSDCVTGGGYCVNCGVVQPAVRPV